MDSSLLSYFSTKPLEEPAPVSFHVPSPLVFHVHTDRSRQCIFLLPMGLLRYQALAPFQRPLPPKEQGVLGAPSTASTRLGPLAACWYRRGDQCIRWATPYLCLSSAKAIHWCKDRPGNKLLFFFSSVIFNVFLLSWDWVFPASFLS